MVKAFEETVKSPIRGKRHGDIKTAVMGNEKVVKVIKIGGRGVWRRYHTGYLKTSGHIR